MSIILMPRTIGTRHYHISQTCSKKTSNPRLFGIIQHHTLTTSAQMAITKYRDGDDGRAIVFTPFPEKYHGRFCVRVHERHKHNLCSRHGCIIAVHRFCCGLIM